MKKKIRQVTGTQVGITFTKEERELYDININDIVDISDMVIEKDRELKCSVCGKIILTLHIHHINKNHNDNRPENLLKVCRRCHYLIHSKKKIEPGVKTKGIYFDKKIINKLNFYKNAMRIK